MLDDPTINQEINVAGAKDVCEHCRSNIGIEDVFCANCGFPQKGTEEAQKEFRSDVFKHNMEANRLKDKLKGTQKMIFVIAGLTFLSGIIYGAILDEIEVVITNLIISIIYIVLGFWFNKKPFPAVLSAFILYVSMILLTFIIDPSTIIEGIIFKVIILSLFASGIKNTWEFYKFEKTTKANPYKYQ